MKRSILFAFGAIVLIASARPVWAAGDPRADVSHPLNSVFESQRAPSVQTASLSADGPKDELTRPDIEGLAIVDNGDGVSIPDNPFDLEGLTVEILPVDPEAFFYSYQSRSGGFDGDAAAAGTLLSLEDANLSANGSNQGLDSVRQTPKPAISINMTFSRFSTRGVLFVTECIARKPALI